MTTIKTKSMPKISIYKVKVKDKDIYAYVAKVDGIVIMNEMGSPKGFNSPSDILKEVLSPEEWLTLLASRPNRPMQLL